MDSEVPALIPDAGSDPDAAPVLQPDAEMPDTDSPDAGELDADTSDTGAGDAEPADAESGLDARADAGPLIEMAITVDDLSRHGPDTPGLTRQDTFMTLMNTLLAHNVPGVFGFVNAGVVEQSHRPWLQAWLDSGYHFGNHTYNHPNAATVGATAYIDSIIMGEPLLDELYPGRPDAWKTFRFTHANHGANIAERNQIRDFLANRGYRTAWTTIEWGEWIYNNAYARCTTPAQVAALRADQLQRVDAFFDWALLASNELFGRVIPQIVTIHVGGFTAVTADEWLTHLETTRNIRYITLDEALADVVYMTEPPLLTTLGGGFLNQVKNTRGANQIPAAPAPPMGSAICP